MSQNRSPAVMAQRAEPHDSLDDFPTPPWAVRAMLEHVFGDYGADHLTCWEPAAVSRYELEPPRSYSGKMYDGPVEAAEEWD